MIKARKAMAVLLLFLSGFLIWPLVARSEKGNGSHMNKSDIHHPDKILTHRLRGFSAYESTEDALVRALGSNVAFLEIDTRVSKDGEIFVFHDYRTSKDLFGSSLVFAKTPAKTLKQLEYPDGQPLSSLDSLLRIFSNHPDDGKKLCIDIKDFGFEKEHLALVKKYNLQNRVIWVSWIPQALVEMYRLDPSIPLFLSQWNLTRFRMLGGGVTALLSGQVRKVKEYVLIGRDEWNTPLGKYSHGFQHAYFTTRLPEALRDILAHAGGGICVHKSVQNKKMIGYCTTNNLKVMVFSVDSLDEYNELSDVKGIDIIFCDASIGRCLNELSKDR